MYPVGDNLINIHARALVILATKVHTVQKLCIDTFLKGKIFC